MTDVGRANRLVECDAVASADTISIDLWRREKEASLNE